MFERKDKICNTVGIKCDEKYYSYGDFYSKIISLGEKFKEYGIKEKCKVILIMENPLEFVFNFFAISYIDAIIMPIYSQTGTEKIINMIKKYDVNFIVMSEKLKEIQLPFKKVKVKDKDIEVEIYFYSKVRDELLKDVKLILFTSGTTNLPKAIMLSQNNILSNIKAISQYLCVTKEKKILLIKNLNHSSSIVGELLVGIYNGCTVVLSSKLPLTNTILRIIEKNEIDIFFAVPTILKGIITHKNLNKYDLSRLKTVNFYGAPMPQQDILKLIDLFPQTNFIYSYGLTEASPRVTYIEKKDLIQHPASSGKPILDVKISICDTNGYELEVNKQGEITVTGPNVMKGYYKNDEMTNIVIKDDKLFTGDIGYIDDRGFLYVTGRKDNMLISAGKNIYPEEIEGVLTIYEGILEALVTSEKKDDTTRILVAYVVCKTTYLNMHELFLYLKMNLENYKIPKLVNIIEEFEKTPSGKIKRHQSWLCDK